MSTPTSRHAQRDAISVVGVWSIALLFTALTLAFALATEWWVTFFFGGNSLGAWMAVFKVERAVKSRADGSVS